MELIEFKHAVVSRTTDGEVILALMDGEEESKFGRCVDLLKCRPHVAAAMCAAVSSALKGP